MSTLIPRFSQPEFYPSTNIRARDPDLHSLDLRSLCTSYSVRLTLLLPSSVRRKLHPPEILNSRRSDCRLFLSPRNQTFVVLWPKTVGGLSWTFVWERISEDTRRRVLYLGVRLVSHSLFGCDSLQDVLWTGHKEFWEFQSFLFLLDS